MHMHTCTVPFKGINYKCNILVMRAFGKTSSEKYLKIIYQFFGFFFFCNDCKRFGTLYTKVILENIFTKYIAYEIIWQKCSSILQIYLLQVHLLSKHSTSIFISNLAYKLFPNTVIWLVKMKHCICPDNK